jgi:hypothetical protein
MTAQWDDRGGGKLGGVWRSGHAAVDQVAVCLWWSTGVPCIYTHTHTHTVHHMYIQFQLVPDLAERNYCVTRVKCFILLTCTCFNLSNQLFMHLEINTFDTVYCVSNFFISQCRKKLVTYVKICIMHGTYNGARGSAVGWGTALQVGRSRVRLPMLSLEFFIDIILPAALWPWRWLSL